MGFPDHVGLHTLPRTVVFTGYLFYWHCFNTAARDKDINMMNCSWRVSVMTIWNRGRADAHAAKPTVPH
eukprot:scaffold184_cov122-Skeletonema_menzelii.AAC.4